MTQLATDTVAAVGGDSVAADTAPGATVQTAPTEERFVESEAPDNAEQPDTTLDDLYADDVRDEPAPGDEGTPGEENPDVNDEGQNEPAEPAIEAPHSWKAEEKERWKSLPRETQQYLSERETERERFVNSKAQEAAQAESRVRDQAMSELAQFQEQQAQRYRQLAQRFEPQPPDRRLLYTGNPQDQLAYQQQQAEYQDSLAQQQQLQQMAEQETAQAQQIREQQEQQAMQAEAQKLQQVMPEWFEPEKRANLQRELGAIASDLGYPQELLAEANSTDLVALKKAQEWKADAEKWRAYDKSRRTPDGKFRTTQKAPPTPNKPGSAPRQGADASDPTKLLYPND